MRIALIPLKATGAAGHATGVLLLIAAVAALLHPAVRSVARPGDLRPERDRAELRPVPVQAVRPVLGNRTSGRGKPATGGGTSTQKQGKGRSGK